MNYCGKISERSKETEEGKRQREQLTLKIGWDFDRNKWKTEKGKGGVYNRFLDTPTPRSSTCTLSVVAGGY